MDLTDKKKYCFGKDCVRGDFLDKIVILGDNNAGKTSFGYAITEIVTTAGDFSKDIGQRDECSFLNKETGTERATFHYELAYKGTILTYEYSKSSPSSIVSESLLIGKEPVFRYDLKDPSNDYFSRERLSILEPPVPDGRRSMILLMSDLKRAAPDSPVRIVKDFAVNSLYYMAMWKSDVHIGMIDGEDDIERYLIDNHLVDNLKTYLSEEGSVDLDIRESDGRIYIMKENGRLPFANGVSRGTMILCRLFCWINRCKNRDAIIFFDDIDDMFYHRTAENVIR